MKLFEPIVVDLYKPFPLKKVDMQQNNIGRGVIVTLTAGSTIVDPSDEDVKLWAERPDGNISYLACTVQADGTIRAPFSSQMLSVPGEVVVSLEMISGEDDITTPIFKVGVGRNIADHAAAESQNEFSALQESISAVNAALAEVKELKEKGLSKVTFSAYVDFPEVGNAEMLYVDTSDTEKLMMYRWNGAEYAPAGVDVVDPALATVLGFAADAKLTGDALSELNKNFEWKFLGTVNGNTLVNLPSDFSELFIEVRPSLGYAQIFRPIRDVLTSSITNYAIGFAGANIQFIKLGVSLTEVKLAEVSYGGNDKTSGSTVTVYYK